MSPKPAKSAEKNGAEAAANSGISKADLVAALAELQTAMLTELKKSFDEVKTRWPPEDGQLSR